MENKKISSIKTEFLSYEKIPAMYLTRREYDENCFLLFFESGAIFLCCKVSDEFTFVYLCNDEYMMRKVFGSYEEPYENYGKIPAFVVGWKTLHTFFTESTEQQRHSVSDKERFRLIKCDVCIFKLDLDGFFKGTIKWNLTISPIPLSSERKEIYFHKSYVSAEYIVSRMFDKKRNSNPDYDGDYLCIVERRNECGTTSKSHRVLTMRLNKWTGLQDSERVVSWCTLPNLYNSEEPENIFTVNFKRISTPDESGKYWVIACKTFQHEDPINFQDSMFYDKKDNCWYQNYNRTPLEKDVKVLYYAQIEGLKLF